MISLKNQGAHTCGRKRISGCINAILRRNRQAKSDAFWQMRIIGGETQTILVFAVYFRLIEK
jgi:hypothetical protein